LLPIYDERGERGELEQLRTVTGGKQELHRTKLALRSQLAYSLCGAPAGRRALVSPSSWSAAAPISLPLAGAPHRCFHPCRSPDITVILRR
jgi:hypothetical protein